MMTSYSNHVFHSPIILRAVSNGPESDVWWHLLLYKLNAIYFNFILGIAFITNELMAILGFKSLYFSLWCYQINIHFLFSNNCFKYLCRNGKLYPWRQAIGWQLNASRNSENDSLSNITSNSMYRQVSYMSRTKSQLLIKLSYSLASVFAESLEATYQVENEDVVGAAPTGDAPTTSE